MNPVKFFPFDILNKQNEFYKMMDLGHLTFAFKDDRRARWERKKTKRYKKEHSRGKNSQQDYRRKARLEDEDFS